MVISKEHVTPTHYNHTLIHTRHLHESHQPPMSLDGIQNPTESTLYHWSSPSFQALPFIPTCDDMIQNITTIWIKVTTFLNYINYYIQQLEITTGTASLHHKWWQNPDHGTSSSPYIDDNRGHRLAQRACIMDDNRTQAMVLPLLPTSTKPTPAANQRTGPGYCC